jgi:hypothetical protein
VRDLFDHNAIAERLGEDAGASRRRRRWWRYEGSAELVPVHETARRAGHQDGLEGHRDHAGRWPSGTYGHADYELGWAEGEADAPKFQLGGFE